MSADPARHLAVLYVEDAIDQGLLVKAFFSALPGYTVTHAQDGQAALKYVEERSWHLLVTDLNLPGADGFAVIKAFRQRYPDAPVLVTTGYTQAEYEEQALRSGADQVMIKPLNQEEFVARVRSMVERAEAPDPGDSSVLVAIEGRLGDVEMGCGGTLMAECEKGHQVVVVPVLLTEGDASPEEVKAASIAATILGVDLKLDDSIFGDAEAQRALLDRTLGELRPGTVFMPAPDDRDPSRKAAAEVARTAAGDVGKLLAYETATTGLEFLPTRFNDVRAEMVLKMEALAAYQAVGAPRVDLRPRMAQAYARYWGRFKEFTEVEAFEQVTPA